MRCSRARVWVLWREIAWLGDLLVLLSLLAFAQPLLAQAPAARVPEMRYQTQRLKNGITVIVAPNRSGSAAAPVAALVLLAGPKHGPAQVRTVVTAPAADLAAELSAAAGQLAGEARAVVAVAGAVHIAPTLALAARLLSSAPRLPAAQRDPPAARGAPGPAAAGAISASAATGRHPAPAAARLSETPTGPASAAAAQRPLEMTITWPGPSEKAKDAAALAMLGEDLFAGPDARERRSLVHKWRAALAVAGGLNFPGSWSAYQAPGAFRARVLFRPGVSPTLVRELVFRQIHEIEVNGVPLSQLRRTQIWTAAEWLRRGQTAAARALRLARAEWRTGSAQAANYLLAPLYAVEPHAMRLAAARYLSDALGRVQVRTAPPPSPLENAAGVEGAETGDGEASHADGAAVAPVLPAPVAVSANAAGLTRPAPAWRPPAPAYDGQHQNGLRVIIIRDASLPLVTAWLSVPAPPPSRQPLARALARLLPAGSPGHTGAALAEEFQNFGGRLWARAGDRRFIVAASALAPYIGGMLRRLAAVAIHPAIPVAALALQRLNAPAWRAWRQSDPQWLARQEALRVAAPGTSAPPPAITRASLLALARQLLLPNNDARLVIVGDVDPDLARSLSAQYFVDGWRFGYPASRPAPKPMSAGGKLLLVNAPGASAGFAFVPSVPPPAPGDALYGAWVLARWLSAPPRRPVSAPAAAAALRAALSRRGALAAAPLSAAALAAAKARFLAAFMVRWQTQAQLAAAWTRGNPRRMVTAVMAATAPQVQTAARKYLAPPLVVAAGDAAALKVPLSHLARGAITILNAEGAMIGAYPPEGPPRRFPRRRIPQ